MDHDNNLSLSPLCRWGNWGSEWPHTDPHGSTSVRARPTPQLCQISAARTGSVTQETRSWPCYVAAWMVGESGREWIHVYVGLSPFAVHLKLSHHYWSAILQYKIKSSNIKKERRIWGSCSPPRIGHGESQSLRGQRGPQIINLPPFHPQTIASPAPWGSLLVSPSSFLPQPQNLPAQCMCLSDSISLIPPSIHPSIQQILRHPNHTAGAGRKSRFTGGNGQWVDERTHEEGVSGCAKL